MLSFITRRTLLAIPVLLGIMIVVFLLIVPRTLTALARRGFSIDWVIAIAALNALLVVQYLSNNNELEKIQQRKKDQYVASNL